MVGLAGLGVEPQGLLIMGDRLGWFPCIHQGVGQVEVIQIFRLQPDRRRIVRHGLVEAPLPQQHRAEIVVRLGVIGLGLKRGLVMLRRLRQFVLPAVEVPQVVMRHVIAFDGGDHPLEKGLAVFPPGNLFPG